MRRALTLGVCLSGLLLGLLPAGAFAAESGGDKGTYVSIDTLTATVLAGNGRHQVMTVQSGVDVPEPKLHSYVQKVTPRLRDAFAQELQLYAGAMPSGSAPDADYIARRMQGAADRVLGKPGARFLIGGIMVNWICATWPSAYLSASGVIATPAGENQRLPSLVRAAITTKPTRATASMPPASTSVHGAPAGARRLIRHGRPTRRSPSSLPS